MLQRRGTHSLAETIAVIRALSLLVVVLLFVASNARAQESTGAGPAANASEGESVLNVKMKTLAGEDVDLKDYEGKVVVIVNVASKCGFTKQYKELEAVYKKYSDQGLVVLGFPCNQFGGQEPGTAAEIQEFCSANYGVTFDMFEKVEVNGDGACALYKTLTALETEPKGAGKIDWNFEKFLVGRDGKVVARYGSKTTPDAPELITAIELALAKPEAK